jgi:DNA-binding MarR family transcriptional regulator
MDDFGLGHHTGYLLRLAHDHAHHAAEIAFPAGPHPREYAVMTALATYGPVSQQRLADRMVVNRTSMVAIADELERRGYVERRRDPDDRRSYALHLTDAGRATLERLHTEIAVADREMTAALRDDERERMNELLLAFVGSEPGHTIPSQLTDRSGFLVARAHVLARDEANELLRPHGITVRHFGLLTLLDRRGPSSQQAIAGAMLISATMVTQLVDQVEAAGLAERRPNPSDRRSYRVTLTAAGRRTLRAARAVMDGLDARFAAALGPDGDRELQDLLRKLVGA